MIRCLVGGMCHACMCVAYPTFLLVAGILAVSIIFKRDEKYVGLSYIAGGFCVCAIFVLYVLSQGYKDMFLFNPEIREAVFARKNYRNILWELLYCLRAACANLSPFLPIGIITLATWVVSRKRKNIRLAVLIEIIFLPLFPIYLFWKAINMEAIYYLFWLIVWSPFVVSYIDNKEKKNVVKQLIYMFLPAVIVAFFVVGYTSDNGGLKSPLGTLIALPTAIMIYAFAFQEIQTVLQGFWKRICCIGLFGGMVFAELIIFYTHTFFYPNISKCNSRIEAGTFQGIYAVKEDKEYYEKFDHFLKSNLDGTERTIMATNSSLLPVYLYEELLPATYFFSWVPYTLDEEGEMNWEATEQYWAKVTGRPDIILVSEQDKLTGEIVKIMENEYEYVNSMEEIQLYKRNQ